MKGKLGFNRRLFSDGWIVPDENKMDINNVFVLCKASELSLNDEFMKYKPCDIEEKKFKELVEEVIKSGLDDFFRPTCDPSFDRDYGHAAKYDDKKKIIEERKICYAIGERRATGESYNWWKKNALCFCPDRGSRLGARKEYIAFMATLIKELVKMGWRVDEAWDAICNFLRVEDNFAFGEIMTKNTQYIVDSKDLKEVYAFFVDMTRTSKILAWDDTIQRFWRTGVDYLYYDSHVGRWKSISDYSCGCLMTFAGANLYEFYRRYHPFLDFGKVSDTSRESNYSVGWIVLEK